MTHRRQRSILILAVCGHPGRRRARAQGDVTVLDRVSTVGTREPRGANLEILHGDGGRLVDVFLEQERLGRVMTGGDGYGYLRLVPGCAGLMKISVRSGTARQRAACW